MALKVGDKVPEFTAKDQHGNLFNSGDVIGKKGVVLYFYPKDDTPGCTAQACSFRDQYEDFLSLNTEVIGVSGDNEKSHQKFAQKYRLPFTLLTDSNKELRKLFGVPTNLLGLLPGRVTYVIDQNGIIRMIFDHMMAQKHLPKALEQIKLLQK
ncbi:MAG: peroxiredoxin [Flavobacteriales bacterium]|nr:peroxiredoxin [Flavobacteriales bacterium]